jgi:hypothetical protein
MRVVEMATAMVLALNNMSIEAYSAQPHAPMVPYVEKTPRTYAIRAALAAGLTRAARAVEPAAQCSAA